MKSLTRISCLIVVVAVLAAAAVPVVGQAEPPLPTADPAKPGDGSGVSGSPTAATLKIAPPLYQEKLDPGKSKDGIIDVFNVGKTVVTVQPEVENVKMTGDAGDLSFYIGDNPFRLHTFVQIDKTPFVLSPGEGRRLKFRISIPDGVFPGGYFGSILMRIVPPAPDAAQTAVAQSGRVGTLLVLTVNGDADRQGHITEAKLTKNDLSPVKGFALGYANTGNTDKRPLGVAYKPVGTIAIKDVFGLTVKRQDVAGDLVFPGATRKFNAKLSKPLWFGYYRATATLQPDGGGQADKRTVGFWAFSVPGILMALIILGVAALGVSALRRRRRDRQIDPGGSLIDEARREEHPNPHHPASPDHSHHPPQRHHPTDDTPGDTPERP